MRSFRRGNKRLALKAGLFILTVLLSGCATYQGKVSEARNLLEAGRPTEAAEKLKILAETPDGDQLVYLLDYATALQAAGQFKESNTAFLKADRLAEAVDYQSISRVTGSLLLNEEMKQYKGDTFEKVFINAQLALNFVELGQLDEALVEARRINEKYVKLRGEEKKDFELNPFAKYLSAVLWEADRKYDDAAIAYKEAYKIAPDIEGIEEDLIRSAKLAQRPDELAKWKKQFPSVKEKPEWSNKSLGEVIILIQQGWGPRKTTSRSDMRWPVLSPTYSETRFARAQIENVGEFPSRFLYDVQHAAIATLEDDRMSLLGRRVLGIAAKEVAADQLRQKNELLGAVAWIALHASDRADLRQWSTLPQTMQMIRVPLKPGTYKVNIQGLSGSNMPTSDRLENKEVTIKSGRKTFIVWRTLR